MASKVRSPKSKVQSWPGGSNRRVLRTDLSPVMQNLELRRVADFFGELEPVFKRRKERVAFILAFDERQIEVGAEGQRLGIDRCAAADEKIQRRCSRIQFQETFDQPQIGGLDAANLRQGKL